MKIKQKLSEHEKGICLFLSDIKGIGNRTLLRMMEYFEDYEELFKAPKEAFASCLSEKQYKNFDEKRNKEDVDLSYKEFLKNKMMFVTFYEEGYPNRLRDIPDPPFALFYYGSLPCENRFCVAIIGARECSDYGRVVARGLGEFFGKNNIDVISGMARGIDGISQEAAINSGGRSYGVLGNGADICYPAENRELYEKLKQYGGIISIYPPHTKPYAQNFPPRNRIVSGLADVCIVVEARNKSGTLITVDMALEQGKDIYVVPGRITDRHSDGCNKLIKDGAGIILSPIDFLNEMRERGYIKENVLNKLEIKKENGEEKGEGVEQMIMKNVDLTPTSFSQIYESLKEIVEPDKLKCLLMKLCVEGEIIQVSPGYFKLKN